MPTAPFSRFISSLAAPLSICRSLTIRAALVSSMAFGAMAMAEEAISSSPGNKEAASGFNETVAEQTCRHYLRIHPQDAQVYQTLLKLAQARPLPVGSPAMDMVQCRLPAQFAQLQSPSFVLFSDADPSLTGRHAHWVERTYEEFQRFVQASGLHPWPLEHKLVCVLFEHRADYQQFAQSQDGLSNAAFSGYYSPRNDRVVFSLEPDGADGSSARHSVVKSDAGTAAVDEPSKMPAPAASSAAPAPAKAVLGFDTRPVAENGSAQSPPVAAADHCGDLQNESAAKCVHETIHQLMFHTRIMSPEVQYPLWICEGLSTAFETNAPDQPFGPDHDFAPRREIFQTLLATHDLLPLRDLVMMAQIPGNNPRTTRAVYHESYALVVWLCREHISQVRAYLQAMLNEPAGRLPARRHLELFEQAFGDVPTLERAWLADEQSAMPDASWR